MAVCPICGNTMTKNVCMRCQAIQFNRDRQWRSGDHGGKRPERTHLRRSMRDALHGVWYNHEHGLTITIDSEEEIYYRSYKGKKTRHRWQFVKEEGSTAQFFKDSKLIKASFDSRGFLVLTTGNDSINLLCRADEQSMRTCPNCFHKTNLNNHICPECNNQF